jgi:RNA polymerase-binding transcription factor DksA
MAMKKKASKPAKKAKPVKKTAAPKSSSSKSAKGKKAATPSKSVSKKPAPKSAGAAKTVKENKSKKPETAKTIKLIAPPPIPVRKKPEPAKPVKVVMPVIKTKTAVQYRPEFTKSVLDVAEVHHSGPTMRYSDSDLAEFKEIILRKLEQAKKELSYLQGLITRKDEMGGDETENRYMTMEDGSVSMEREQLAQMASRQINYIDHLEKAMMRIENKTYGICRVTGKLIDKARLRAVPHATLSIEAKEKMNK